MVFQLISMPAFEIFAFLLFWPMGFLLFVALVLLFLL